MSADSPIPLSVYQYPRYYAIGYQWNTKAECDFLEACLATYTAPLPARAPARPKFHGAGGEHREASGPAPRHRTLEEQAGKPSRILDIGCGAGRHLLELARRGHTVTGFDLRPEMVAFAQEQARAAKLPMTVYQDDLRSMKLEGTYELAACLMDTFRYLLTNEHILRHLAEVADHLSSGGLYVTDFWIPTRWDQIANEVYQWEQTEGDTTVRVFYVQHPESADPISQTFEDELVFSVQEGGKSQEIRGERTRTRLMLPQEFRALVQASAVFDLVGMFADFDLEKPLHAAGLSWRMVSVLKKRT